MGEFTAGSSHIDADRFGLARADHRRQGQGQGQCRSQGRGQGQGRGIRLALRGHARSAISWAAFAGIPSAAGVERRVASFSHPNLHEAVDHARRHLGAGAVVDLLVAVLTDPRVRSDADIDEHIDALKSACRQSRRYREAIPVFERIADLNPARRCEIAAELALVHAHLGEPAQGVSLLAPVYREQRRLAAGQRSLAFCLVAELAATALREPRLARGAAEMARALVRVPARGRSAAARMGAASLSPVQAVEDASLVREPALVAR